jgi:hypothetical protein
MGRPVIGCTFLIPRAKWWDIFECVDCRRFNWVETPIDPGAMIGDLLHATSAIGASRPLPCVPAMVSFLIQQRALSVCDGNWSSCPISDLRADGFERLSRVASRRSSSVIGYGLRLAIILLGTRPRGWA